jgi:hypothetical protein
MFACNSPARPSVTVVAGRPTSPAENAALSYYSQPITLIVTPGVTATGAPPTTVLEVATDSAFASVVSTQTLPPAVNGQATATLNHLSAATTYYWRVKTTAGDNPIILSATSSFSIGPLLVIQPPTPVTPLGDTFPHKRPTFIVANAMRTGPPATVIYRFDIATDATFQTVVATGTAAEGSSQTSFVLNVDLVQGTSYVWRAQASDIGKGVTSGYSGSQLFTTRNPDDGTYPYTFHFQLPDTEDCEYVVNAITVRYRHELDFPVSLVVADNALTVDEGLVLHGNRTQGQLSGTISGRLPLTAYASLSLSGQLLQDGNGKPPFPASFFGTADLRGNLAGTFSGSAMAADCCYGWACAAPDFKWTLMPR